MQTGAKTSPSNVRGARAIGLATDPRTFEELYRKHYLAAQYVFVQFFVDHLTDVSREFKGDLQVMLILATLGQVHLDRARRIHDPATPAEAPVDVDLGWTTSSRLADVTGIPRQTVRRKLLNLQQRGWIVQNDQQGWMLRQGTQEGSARADLSDLDQRAMQRVSKLIANFNDLLVRTMPVGLLILAA